MRITAIAGLFAFVAIATLNSSTVSAEALDLIKNNITQQTSSEVSLLSASTILDELKDEAEKPTELAAKPTPVVHTVDANETLSSVAEQHKTTWVRIFNKNEHIINPDVLSTGEKLTVPLPEEALKDRPLPTPPISAEVPDAPAQVAPPTPRPVQNREAPASNRVTVARGAVAGNRYSPGYCTWYAKNKRPDMPNNLGNADTWVMRAAAQGIATGSTPSVGAIGQQGMHVVYVESVNPGGTVTVSEMNYSGLYVIGTRTVPAGTFMYIY